MLDNLQPGDRVRITHHEFKDWIPTNSTVIKLAIRFVDTPMADRTITVRLDKHPFPKVLFEPMRDLGFSIDDPNIELERIDKPKP